MNNPRLTIDRMVDGELDFNSERELLLDCESNDRWRELALAFVESRALQKEIPGFVADFGSDQTQETPIPGTTWEAKPHTPAVLARESKGRSILSLAATALLALGLGYAAGWAWKHSSVPDNFAQHTPTTRQAESKLPRSMPFIVDHPNTQELQQIEIPLLDAKDLGPDWQQALQNNSWDALVEEMRQQGLNMRQHRTITPVRLSTGQRVVIPVDYFIEQPYQ